VARTSLRWDSPSSLVRPQPVAALPAFVQAAVADTGNTEPASLDVVLGAGATAGNLIVIAANSDATLTPPAGFATAASAVSAQGCYCFWKIAAGGETTLTVTPSVGRPMALVAAEYSGIAVSPVDQTASNSATGSSTAGPVSAGTTGTTLQAVELAIAVTGPHSYSSPSPPGSPTWTNSYTGRGAAASALVATAGRNSAVFLADLVLLSTGTTTTSTSWTNSSQDWGAVIATFKGA
jgi:hypothetical protein